MEGLNELQIKAYRDAFALFDKDHDGKITAFELTTVMHQLGFTPSDAEVRKMIKEVDKNLNDTVEFDEFVCMMKKHQKLRDAEQELRDAFRMFDVNGDGCISRDELRTVMNILGEKLTDQELDAMIREADLNGDGKVNYEEFVRMWMQQKDE